MRRGRWTAAAAAQARVVARMRERGHSLEDLKRAGREGRLAFGFAEDLFPKEEEQTTLEEVARETGLEPELVERILVILGTPLGQERLLGPEDVQALRHCARVLAAGFPLVAFLQLVRVYVQSLRRIADAEVRLFHLYVHEPLIRDGVPELEMAEEMGELAGDILPLGRAADRLPPHPLPALLPRAGRRRPHGERSGDGRVAGAPRPGHPLLHRPHRLHPLHRGGGRPRGARRGRELRRNGRGDAAARGDDREDDRRRGDGRLARPRLADRVGGRPAGPLLPSARSPGSESTTPRPSTATATTSAPTSTSPTGSSTAPRPARCW